MADIKQILKQRFLNYASTTRLSRAVTYGKIALPFIAFAIILAGLQAALFYNEFTPRIAQANKVFFDLLVEKAQGNLFRSIDAKLELLSVSSTTVDESTQRLVVARDNFDDYFAVVPLEAIETLRGELSLITDDLQAADGVIDRIDEDLERLLEMYSDSYKLISADLDRPSFYLWPTANWLAGKSGYRQAVTFNRALYLSQVGEVGTARVMLTGLHASTEDPQALGLINYTLGRLQFELFVSRPEAEFYTQSVQYLRQSLQADPDSPLAKRFFDYLLSLSQTASAPRAGEGNPTNPSEGQGAAISAEKRKF